MTNNCKFVKTLEFMRNRKNHLTEKLHKNKTEKILISKDDAVLLSSARDASSKAIRSTIALGITYKVIRNHQIVAVNPDKTIKVLRKISKSTIDVSSLKKGMILERK